MDVNFANHPFVQFVEQLTAQPAVQIAVSRLESQDTINVNLILYAIWYGQNQRGRLLKQDLRKLFSASHSWHECIRLTFQRSINAINQNHSDRSKKLQKFIAAELRITNQIEQRLIAETLLKFNRQKRNPSQQLSDACYSIMSYCNLLHLRINEADRKAIGTLLQASFSNLIAAEVEQACENSLNHSITNSHYAQLKLDEM